MTSRTATATPRQLLLDRLRRRAAESAASPDTGGGPAELSFAQQRLWFLDQWSPGNLAYVIPVAWRLRGDLDLPALRAAVQGLADRHPSLRTSFPIRDGSPIQVVHPHARLDLTTVDLQGLPAGDRESAASRQATEAARVPFDLATGPLARAVLFVLGHDEHLLLLAVHHIASDGWSTGLLREDLAAGYVRARRGEPAALPTPAARYLDYAATQRRELTGPTLRRHLEHWAREIDGVPMVLDLSIDKPRPPVQTFHGATHWFQIPTDVTARLRALCTAHGATMFMVLLAGFGALLHRYTRQERLLVGTPAANRTRAEYEAVVGLFVNTLALPVDCAGDPTFSALVARVRRGALTAYDWQDTPFDRLVDHLRIDRDPARSPLTQVLFAMQYPQGAPPDMAGVSLTPVELETGTTTSELVLNVRDDGDELTGFVEYNTDLFEADTMARMFANLVALLGDATVDPDRPLSQIRGLSEAEEDLVLRGFNQTAVPWPDATIGTLFARQVAATPDATALVCGDRRLTFRELDRRAALLAGRLSQRGVAPGSLVGVFLERSEHLLISLLAVLKAGGAYVPLDPDYPADRLAYMVSDSGAALVLTSSDLRDRMPDITAPVLVVDGEDRGGNSGGNDNGGDDSDVAAEPAVAGREATADDLAYMIYTSGSTGRPKGVQIPHRGVVNHLRWLQDTFALTGDDRLLQKTSICFDVSVWELFWPLVTGATLVLAAPGGHRDPSYVGDLIRAQRVTVAYFVPSMLRAFLDAVDVSTCVRLRLVFCGGEAMPVDLQNRLLAAAPVRLLNIYGPTETSIDATWWECRPGWTRPSVPIGHPVANTEIYVLDQAMRPVPIGVPGEAYIGGLQLARGYGGRPELTRERFLPDPYGGRPDGRLYRTGDQVRWLPDGALEFLGRNDDQVKLRGLRIELGEIESALTAHPEVRASAAVVHERTPGDQRLVAYVVPVIPDAVPTPQQLRAHLTETLPEYMVPSIFMPVDTLPLTANGKVDRKALPTPEQPTGTAGAPVVGPLQQQIAEVWQEVLGVTRVGATDTFFDLGGHSLLLVRVHQRLATILPEPVDLVDLFRYPTVAALAAYCERRQENTTAITSKGDDR